MSGDRHKDNVLKAQLASRKRNFERQEAERTRPQELLAMEKAAMEAFHRDGSGGAARPELATGLQPTVGAVPGADEKQTQPQQGRGRGRGEGVVDRGRGIDGRGRGRGRKGEPFEKDHDMLGLRAQLQRKQMTFNSSIYTLADFAKDEHPEYESPDEAEAPKDGFKMLTHGSTGPLPPAKRPRVLELEANLQKADSRHGTSTGFGQWQTVRVTTAEQREAEEQAALEAEFARRQAAAETEDPDDDGYDRTPERDPDSEHDDFDKREARKRQFESLRFPVVALGEQGWTASDGDGMKAEPGIKQEPEDFHPAEALTPAQLAASLALSRVPTKERSHDSNSSNATAKVPSIQEVLGIQQQAPVEFKRSKVDPQRRRLRQKADD
eukprot:TRINITY_DN17622_c0_g1_i1.p1 TRINITY_DN17622_c0_g1~~TRINITY_DN17622_c0_g1_i1.p1  ORF type:complete len:381 (-),score=51.72 TRINITY_DN17622_c0_g1_i1:17-1159(-)